MLPEIVICICQGSEDIEAPPESSEELQLVVRQQQLALAESIEAFDWISEMCDINAFDGAIKLYICIFCVVWI